MIEAIKIFLGILIIGITTYLGYQKSRKLYEREYILREYVIYIETVEKQMKYTLAILPDILECCRVNLKTRLKGVMGNIVVDMLEEKDVGQSIIQNINSLDCLDSYDKSNIISTLSSLGKNSIELDTSLILSSIDITQNQIKEATDVKIKQSKMYRTLRSSIGAYYSCTIYLSIEKRLIYGS